MKKFSYLLVVLLAATAVLVHAADLKKIDDPRTLGEWKDNDQAAKDIQYNDTELAARITAANANVTRLDTDGVTNVTALTLAIPLGVTNVTLQLANVYDSTGAACSNAAGVAILVATNLVLERQAAYAVVTNLSLSR